MATELRSKFDRIPFVYLQPSFNKIFELIDCSDVRINSPNHNIFNQKATLTRGRSKGFNLAIDNVLSDMAEPYEVEIILNENSLLKVKHLIISISKSKIERKGNTEFLGGKFPLLARYMNSNQIYL